MSIDQTTLGKGQARKLNEMTKPDDGAMVQEAFRLGESTHDHPRASASA